jgi:hypothetical protein
MCKCAWFATRSDKNRPRLLCASDGVGCTWTPLLLLVCALCDSRVWSQHITCILLVRQCIFGNTRCSRKTAVYVRVDALGSRGRSVLDFSSVQGRSTWGCRDRNKVVNVRGVCCGALRECVTRLTRRSRLHRKVGRRRQCRSRLAPTWPLRSLERSQRAPAVWPRARTRTV